MTIHPHGIFYAQEMDGAYKGRFTDAGGFVQKNRTFHYVWEARPGHRRAPGCTTTTGRWTRCRSSRACSGRWWSATRPGPRPDQEFFIVMHTFTPTVTSLNQAFSCINGRAFAGNTPTLQASVGQRVAFHVYGMDDAFHTFHIHGHRWTNAAGEIVDNATFGPGDVITAEFVEDNPGRWFYHCHVLSHLHMGMNGWYLVS